MAAELSDPRTFERAYDEHGAACTRPRCGSSATPSQAQDVTQDVFLRLWRRPEAFDARRGELGSYLRLMARSRARRPVARGPGRRADVRPPQARGRRRRGARRRRAGAGAERDESRAAVRSALRELPTAQREALVLAYWGGMTADEIARRSHVPLGTAKSRIRLGPRAAARGVRAASRRAAYGRGRCHKVRTSVPLSSNARSTAEPRHTTCRRAGDPLPRQRLCGANPRPVPR